ncbi:S8 family serine peptidase [Candidatus Woesearchaeota archaeon]|nr:S8 family serine peptidase [Candidatus Woesearchaeota archaeon]
MARLLSLVFALALVLLISASAQSRSAYVDPAIDDALASGGKVKVLVVLKTEPVTAVAGIADTLAQDAPDAKKERIRAKQEKLLQRLQRRARLGVAESTDGAVLRQLENTPAITARVNRRLLDLLASSPDVQGIYLSKQLKLALSTTVGVINADEVWGEKFNGTNITGAGVSVCVLDTGVDGTHESLAGKVVNEKCYCSVGGGCCQGLNESSNATDDNGHGTHVASTVAANGNLTGVAKGSSIVAVKVCNSAGSCDLADIALAFDYCVNQSSTYNISVITMSISDGSAYATAASCPTSLDVSISEAVGSGMLVTISSGNEGSTTGVGYPACSPNATSVGATVHDGTSMASYGNRGPLLDVVAPGSSVVAAKASVACPGSCSCSGTTATCSGTSMAAPHVAGIGALLAHNARLRNMTFDPRLVETFLEETSIGVGGFRMANAIAALVRQNVNYTFNATNNSLSNPGAGAVHFRSTVNVSRLGECFNISSNNVTLADTDANCTQYNASATVRLFNLGFHDAKPFLNGQPCSASECQNRSYGDGVMRFDVTHFSSFTAGSAVNLTISDDTDNESRFINDQVSFLANFSNTTGPVNTSIGACRIAFNTTGSYGSLENMTFSSTRQKYAFNRSFDDDLDGTYNVTCSSFNETLTTTDAFSIQNETIAPIIALIAPTNGSTSNTSVLVVYTFNVTDNSTIADCSLSINGTINATDTTVGRNVNQTFNVTMPMGTVSWNVTCADAGGTSATSGTFTHSVTAVNVAPSVIANISNQSWTEDTNQTVNLTPVFSDANGDPLTYTALASANMSVHTDNSTGIATLIPAANFTGAGTVVFIAHDVAGATNQSNNVTLNVTPLNDAPSLTGTIPNQSWSKGNSNNNAFDLDSYFTDADNATLIYASTGTSSITVSIDSSTHLVSFSQGSSFTGNETVTFNASDGQNSALSNAVRLQVTSSSSTSSSGGGATCTNDCDVEGFMTCSSLGEVRCGNYDDDSCLDASVVPCLSGYACAADSGGCVRSDCTEQWLCDDWAACEDGQQARVCEDANLCGTGLSKPPTVQACIVEPQTLTTAAEPASAPVAIETVTPVIGANETCGIACKGIEVCGSFCAENSLRRAIAFVLLVAMTVYVLQRRRSFLGKNSP